MITPSSPGLYVALLVAHGGQAADAVAAPEPGVTAPPSLAVTFVRPAVDHVVTYAFWRGFGPKGRDRSTMLRHDNLVRMTTEYIGSKRDVDPASVTSYSNLATNASVQGTLRGPGDASGFTFWREDKAKPGRYRYHLIQTHETRTIAGERCIIWRADPIGDPHSGGRGVQRRACIAGDGVVLYDAWLYSSGGIGEERTAIRVERRDVTPAEVLPPREAMNWQAWMARAATVKPTATGRPRNFDLLLKRESSCNYRPDRVRFSGSEGWERTEDWCKGKLQRFHFYHSSFALRAHATSDRLEIYFAPEPKVAPWDTGDEPADREREKVLGEECRWFNTTANVADYHRYECRAKDGLPLMIEEGSQGVDEPTLVAFSVSRGKTAMGELMPPPSLLRWDAWGWPELGRPAPDAPSNR